MKISKTFYLLVISLAFSVLFSFGCSSDDSNPTGGSDALVGTWNITSITSTVEGVTLTIGADDIPLWLTLAPELGMVPGTIVLNADGTYNVTYLDTEVETGTWTATGSILSVTSQGETVPIELPYTISGNQATISMSVDDGEGGILTAELVYTKQ
ncbi:lipocalin family protein [Bacteroidota bacterium]